MLRTNFSLKVTAFWNVTACSPEEINLRFTGTYCPHLEGQIIKPSRKQAAWKMEGGHVCESNDSL
jgi:hypothetical protein